ncbi:MAG: WYL domain-containing protein [Betaproteobacteria bacterium]|nr:WYL domain-containing protein [Betaproteobacteria bacterium]
MDRFQRILLLHRLLASHRLPVSHRTIEQELECSRATATRIIEEMRDYLGAPIAYDRPANGYRYTHDAFELPGLWFNASELYALITVQKLLTEAQPGFLDGMLGPLKTRIENILQSEHLGSGEVGRRVRILPMAGCSAGGEYFQTGAGALLQRKRIEILYHGRERDEETDRVVSPQRLVHYRDNWYLDAWCHSVERLRSFALERIRIARPLDDPAVEVADEELDAHFARGYGIFAGEPVATAVLRFTPERARWVAEETWHPAQNGRFLEDGRFELRIPYSDDPELIMDILKYGPGVD